MIVVICPTAQGKMCTTGNWRMAGMRTILAKSLRAQQSNPEY
jgi:hypothetical protein